jgi:hypothetical protein
MNFNVRRLLYTPLGKIIISIILGLGIATLFRQVCNDQNCLVYRGIVLSEIEGKTMKYNNQCYQYTHEHVSCDANKKIVDIYDDCIHSHATIDTPALNSPTNIL